MPRTDAGNSEEASASTPHTPLTDANITALERLRSALEHIQAIAGSNAEYYLTCESNGQAWNDQHVRSAAGMRYIGTHARQALAEEAENE